MESPAIIEEAATLLRKPLTFNEEQIETYIIELDAIRYDVAEAIANQQRLLYEKRKQMLWPKDAEAKLTELDRTIRLNGDVASIERDYKFLELIWVMLEQKLEFSKKWLLENLSLSQGLDY